MISIDRYLAIKNPLKGRRFTIKTARVYVLLVWLITTLISIASVGLAGEKSDIFRTSEVCIGIPIIRPQETKININRLVLKEMNIDSELVENWHTLPLLNGGELYKLYNITISHEKNDNNVSYPKTEITGTTHSPILSLFMFIVVNLTCFIIVACCYIEIFRLSTSSSKQVISTNTKRSREFRMARKMFPIVFTDFCCWIPLCFVCILVQCQVVTVSPKLYAWIIGFILPINSTINPILYVMKDEISNFFKTKKESNSKDILLHVRSGRTTSFKSNLI